MTVTFLLAVWSIIINTATGEKKTPPSLIDVGRVYKSAGGGSSPGSPSHRGSEHLRRPPDRPRQSSIGMVIAQMEISVTGLGGLVINYGNAFKTAYLLAAICTA